MACYIPNLKLRKDRQIIFCFCVFMPMYAVILCHDSLWKNLHTSTNSFGIVNSLKFGNKICVSYWGFFHHLDACPNIDTHTVCFYVC